MKLVKPVILIGVLALSVIISCKKDAVQDAPQQNSISEEVLSKIRQSGFSSDNVQKIGDGYLVENDILLHEHDLVGSKNRINVGKEEQYRTTAIVTGLPKTITVSVSGFSSPMFAQAAQQAVAAYNALGLRLRFQYVTGSASINITAQCLSGGVLGYGGFPSGGNPYPSIVLNSCSSYFNTVCKIKKVMEHEIGHCIGFRHTDWMNRAYSCGGTPTNEGTAGVGAVQIPGTPSSPDAGSWMLACASSACTSFNSNDITALRYLYQ
ncbi:M57 family metalloprotease [Chitinophaga solisilvae]|uniref:Protease n=1 Tax=Chitinophaga solisilvae TaxID=1233460 RepID=A0A3S1CZN6_9BACT|nr:M57 family metalloprotease [Chitinophaga solisilvae]NSL87871.1 protease [Chitinophaga solisilvae]